MKDKGQISIFFSALIVVLITFIAFIVNIGIFVKAKINLQNAVDAAAYAGASVQARQLTNIGYVNWAMRNVFKQWMFKYYVLGGMNLEAITDRPLPTPPGGSACRTKSQNPNKDFTMGCYTRTTSAGEDQYNFPSVCIDFANTGGVGLCTRYLVPGLPRFSQQNVLGMDETTNAFVDTLVAEKSKDCSERTKINFFTANTWTYNVNADDPALRNITEEAPEIAANFPGAFPAAFELGLRIRNLESEVNFPPQQGVCADPGSGIGCSVAANTLNSPHQERAFKAFTSAFRNLGSGIDREMKDSFTLTELAPKLDTSISGLNSLSTLLIPEGSQALNKYYVDLKLLPVNYAIFYTALATQQNNINVQGNTIAAEGQCTVTKVGLPVPGYPLHFVKNPDFLTYYAVEGRANFVGLFNPFSNDITLKAYAAAKPFGGRIGPHVFNAQDKQVLVSRSQRKSSPYISALDTASFKDAAGQTNPGVYSPGKPIPINAGSGSDKFWMTDDLDNIGGYLPGPEIYFGLPNMIYDYPSNNIGSNDEYLANLNVQVIGYFTSGTPPAAGLYNAQMFDKFRSKLKNFNSIVSPQDINEALIMSTAPTLYEAHNWMIPSPELINRDLAIESYGVIESEPTETYTDANSNSYQIYDTNLYAPLYSPNNPFSLYRTSADLVNVLNQYIANQEQAILKYKSSMNLVASDIYRNNRSGATDQNTGVEAARAISDLTNAELNSADINTVKAARPSCNSISGKFIYFYSGNLDLVSNTDASECISPLRDLLAARWNNPNLSELYNFKYALPVDEDFQRRLFSAYHPGEFHGAQQGVQTIKLGGDQVTMLRNFYSTKFIPVKSVTDSNNAMFNSNSNMIILSEGAPRAAPAEIKRSSFKNPIQPAATGIDLDRIHH